MYPVEVTSRIILAGGRDFSGSINSCQVYDVAADSWLMCAQPFPVADYRQGPWHKSEYDLRFIGGYPIDNKVYK